MKTLQEQIRNEAKRLLEGQEVSMVVGYGQGSDAFRTTPIFIKDVGKVDQLIINPFTSNNLVKYLMDLAHGDKKVAVVVKGCDSRSVNRLVQDNQLERDKVIVLGVPCGGQLDLKKLNGQLDPRGELIEVTDNGDSFQVKTSQGEATFNKSEYLMDKCLVCESSVPVSTDMLLTYDKKPITKGELYQGVKDFEKLSTEEKNAFWQRQFDKCIRCYACRNICSACSCRECVFDMAEPNWIGKRTNLSENHMFHLTRAIHVAGRCVDCGECDRVCPMDIPLRLLNQKVLKDAKELFDVGTPGANPEEPAALGYYRKDDPEEFHG